MESSAECIAGFRWEANGQKKRKKKDTSSPLATKATSSEGARPFSRCSRRMWGGHNEGWSGEPRLRQRRPLRKVNGRKVAAVGPGGESLLDGP